MDFSQQLNVFLLHSSFQRVICDFIFPDVCLATPTLVMCVTDVLFRCQSMGTETPDPFNLHDFDNNGGVNHPLRYTLCSCFVRFFAFLCLGLCETRRSHRTVSKGKESGPTSRTRVTTACYCSFSMSWFDWLGWDFCRHEIWCKTNFHLPKSELHLIMTQPTTQTCF